MFVEENIFFGFVLHSKIMYIDFYITLHISRKLTQIFVFLIFFCWRSYFPFLLCSLDITNCILCCWSSTNFRQHVIFDEKNSLEEWLNIRVEDRELYIWSLWICFYGLYGSILLLYKWLFVSHGGFFFCLFSVENSFVPSWFNLDIAR